MSRTLLLFEDRAWSALTPLTDLTPTPALAFGASTLAERWSRRTRLPIHAIAARGQLTMLRAAAGAQRRARGRASSGDDLVLAVNAAALPGRWITPLLGRGGPAAFTSGGRMAAALLPKSAAREPHQDLEGLLRSLALPERGVDAVMLAHPWDLITHNAGALAEDLAPLPGRIRGRVHTRAVLVGRTHITIEPGAIVDPLAVLDASDGPIWIGARAHVRPHTLIEGPCVIGEGTELLGGRIARSTIGPQCRIAGEVEECIWQGFSNKRHHGFVGHSVIGEWVNLGALTTTSDLKNNYGSVRVWTPDGEQDSGSNKIGSFLGAHVKTGIGTLLPTGASVGTGANLFGGGVFAPKRVPAFGWWDGERMAVHQWDKFLATARLAMSRRGETLDPAAEAALQRCFEASRAERERR